MADKVYFSHMKNKEFEEKWRIYKDKTVEIMDETSVARLRSGNVEIYIALEKDFGNEYITIFTTICKSRIWSTEDFFSDDAARNNKIKLALQERKWDTLKQIMTDMLVVYCRGKRNSEGAKS